MTTVLLVIKDTYTQFLQDRFSNEDAYENHLKKFREFNNNDDGPLLGYACGYETAHLAAYYPKKKKLNWIYKTAAYRFGNKVKMAALSWMKY